MKGFYRNHSGQSIDEYQSPASISVFLFFRDQVFVVLYCLKVAAFDIPFTNFCADLMDATNVKVFKAQLI